MGRRWRDQLLAAALQISLASGCESQWTLSGDRCYQFFSSGGTFTSTNEACASTASTHTPTLAVITTAEQNTVAATLAGSNSEVRIGLQYNTVTGSYEWVDGTPYSYAASWHNYCSGASCSDPCVRLVGADHGWSPTKWDDWSCTGSSVYLCSYTLPSPPPPLPPAAPGPSAGASGDPHLKGAHGEEADFKGEHRGIYNALSARNFSLNLMVEHALFRTPFSKLNVNGSWMRGAFHTVRTRQTGRLLQIFFHGVDPHRAIVTEGCTAPMCFDGKAGAHRHVVVHGAPAFQVENLKVWLQHKTLFVSNGEWHTTAESTVGAPHQGKLRVNVQMKPIHAVCYSLVSPHGCAVRPQTILHSPRKP
eukprot:7119995-Prymnesium_polylepis.1